MAQIDLDGQVVVVTGAGGGLGRSHALHLAEHGARVVVNDLGGSSGSGPSAAAVVEEIEAAGGTALAVEASVSDPIAAASIVEQAVSSFGRIDALVNNAGILRDRSFAKMTEDEVRAVLEVHLLGAFHLTGAAWPLFREQGFGRVVNTTSPAGLFGNFGQANYAAAKMGLVGFTRTLSIEGQRSGIHANVIAPLAATSMTESVLPEEALQKLDPRHVSPLVTYLCSKECQHTGGIFAVGGGYVGRVAVLQGRGVSFGDELNTQALADRWSEVTSMADPTEFDGGAMEQGDWVLDQI